MKFFLLTLLLFSFSVSALKESEISFVYELLENKEDFYQLGNFKNTTGNQLKYAQFGTKKGKKGSVVFVSGFGENIFKYLEFFYDLNALGYSPIYTYDHVGQGFSESLLENTEFGYIDSYKTYVKDLDLFLKQVVLKNPEVDSDHLFLTSHSMGSLISALYLEENSNTFQAAVLSSPLIKLKTNLPSFAEKGALVFFRFLCLFQCESPTWNPNKIGKEVRNTHSDARYKFSKFIPNEYPVIYIDEPTYKWVIEIFKATHFLIKEARVSKIKTPILMLQAKQELLVSKDYQVKFCDKISGFCKFKEIDEKHEILLGRDQSRNQAIQAIVDFFESNKD